MVKDCLIDTKSTLKPSLPEPSTSKYIPFSKKNDLKNKKNSNTKNMLNSWYNNILSEMSTVPKVGNKATDEDSIVVECYCVNTPLNDNIVFCAMCGKGQHAQCVHFKPKPFQEMVYLCSICWTINDKFQCKATLIIVPQSILNQWINEVTF